MFNEVKKNVFIMNRNGNATEKYKAVVTTNHSYLCSGGK